MRPTTINSIEPIARFRELVQLLGPEPAWWLQGAWARFAAQAVALRPAAAQASAAQIHALTAELRAKAPWVSRLGDGYLALVAAIVLAAGDSVDGLLADLKATGPELKLHGYQRVGAPEVSAILIMRLLHDGRTTRAEDVARTRDIHRLMRTHHWWLTAREDLPVCALLGDRHGSPAEVEARAEGIFQALRAKGFGDPDLLQTVSALLALNEGEVDAVVARFTALLTGFGRHRPALLASGSAAVAMLSWLDLEPERVVDAFLALHDEIRSELPFFIASVAETVTADLVFIDLVRRDRRGQATDEPAVERMRLLLRRQRAASLVLADVPTDVVVLAPDWPLLWGVSP